MGNSLKAWFRAHFFVFLCVLSRRGDSSTVKTDVIISTLHSPTVRGHLSIPISLVRTLRCTIRGKHAPPTCSSLWVNCLWRYTAVVLTYVYLYISRIHEIIYWYTSKMATTAAIPSSGTGVTLCCVYYYGGPKLIGPNIVSEKGKIYRFLCIP